MQLADVRNLRGLACRRADFGNKAILFPYSLRAFTRISGFVVSKSLIVSLTMSAVLLALLEILVTYTGFGRQIRAVAKNRSAAEIMGINT